MKQIIIHGNVNGNGTIYSGTGDYNVNKFGTGLYQISFNKPFSEVPSASVTQNFQAWSDFSFKDGSTLDNAVIVALNETDFLIKTGASNGKVSDRNFSFIVIGSVN